jgi:hypothetical protein
MADTFENSRRRALPTISLQIAALAAVTVGCVSGEVSPRRSGIRKPSRLCEPRRDRVGIK